MKEKWTDYKFVLVKFHTNKFKIRVIQSKWRTQLEIALDLTDVPYAPTTNVIVLENSILSWITRCWCSLTQIPTTWSLLPFRARSIFLDFTVNCLISSLRHFLFFFNFFFLTGCVVTSVWVLTQFILMHPRKASKRVNCLFFNDADFKRSLRSNFEFLKHVV